MGRFFLTLLAAITAVIGVLMDSVWLLVAAGAFFALALIVLIALAARRSRRRRKTPPPEPAASREEELRSLGLGEVRPKNSGSDAASVSAPPAEPARPHGGIPVDQLTGEYDDTEDDPYDDEGTGAAATPETGPLPSREAAAAWEDAQADALRDLASSRDEPEEDVLAFEEAPSPPSESRPVLQAADDHSFWQAHSPTAMGSFLRALWAAAEVQTALLVARESDDSFTLLAARSHLPAVYREGRFPADSFMKVADPERVITVLAAGDPLTRHLPYYRHEAVVSEVAILPVAARSGELIYLVADLPGDQPAFTDRQRILLLGFAELLETLMTHPSEEAPTRALPTRRSIIAEEMGKARAQNRPLALALVYRTDAEAVSHRSEASIAEAERELRLFIEDLTAQGRIEHFGESMFGVMLPHDRNGARTWGERLIDRAERKDLPIAVGVALLEDHEDPDHLRADAVNALHVAVQAGTPLVIQDAPAA